MIPTESKSHEDSLLLEQIRSGNKKAFDILFDKYWEDSLNKAYKRTKDLDSAKDIVQEIFTQIWIKRETPIMNLPAYLPRCPLAVPVKPCRRTTVSPSPISQ